MPQDVFGDLGCGMGRIVCVAARKTVRKSIGVELLEPLCEIAHRNATLLRGRKASIQIVCGDATTVDLSEGTIYFMFNPFGARTSVSRLRSRRLAGSLDGQRHAPSAATIAASSASSVRTATPAGSTGSFDCACVDQGGRGQNDIAPASTAAGSAVIPCRCPTRAATDINDSCRDKVNGLAYQNDGASAPPTHSAARTTALSALGASHWPGCSATKQHVVLSRNRDATVAPVPAAGSASRAWRDDFYGGVTDVHQTLLSAGCTSTPASAATSEISGASDGRGVRSAVGYGSGDVAGADRPDNNGSILRAGQNGCPRRYVKRREPMFACQCARTRRAGIAAVGAIAHEFQPFRGPCGKRSGRDRKRG